MDDSNGGAFIYDREEINQNNYNDATSTEQMIHDDHNWRNIITFWILGMCNNYGLTVMLSATSDIIKRVDTVWDGHNSNPPTLAEPYKCIEISTGTFLLADTIPSLIVKLIAPFLPFYVNINMLLTCITSAIGVAVVAMAQHEWQAIVGIIFTSLGGGLGETSLLAYTPKFNRNVILAFSSGTGAAGIAGALTYTILIDIGFKPTSTMLLMLLVPLIQLLVFFLILKEPKDIGTNPSSQASSSTSLIDHSNNQNIAIIHPSLSFSEKIRYTPNLLKYCLPLFLIYLSEHIINQGLYNLIFVPDIWLDQPGQYSRLLVIYYVGVFVSRSSFNFFSTKRIWLMSILQVINVIYFTFQAIFMTFSTIWIIFAIAFWEGLLGGYCFINTYNRVVTELPIQYKSFGMSVTNIGQTCGVVLAGFLAIPIHNLICKLQV